MHFVYYREKDWIFTGTHSLLDIYLCTQSIKTNSLKTRTEQFCSVLFKSKEIQVNEINVVKSGKT